ncbi:MAG: FAD-dependent oxidoreductase, partial [Phycisphaerae bacterium]|nr:FAD-dependent oxidoreductase [Phycisphaerae bacterium]
MMNSCDVCVLGAGHNGLTSAVFLARAGLRVHVLERSSVLGGAARTERPFAKAPELGHSTGAYLLGVMPPELMDRLALPLELVRRDPHYFLPTLDGRSLLLGADANKNDDQLRTFFSEADANAVARLEAELAQLREDLAPAWLQEALSITETAERFIRPELRDVFVRLCQEPVEHYLNRFGFKSELLLAMYAVTDGFSGLSASFGMEGTGHNFLVHNMCRLRGSGGTWMIAKGGMGAVSQALADEAKKAGATIETNAEVTAMEREGNGWRLSGSFGECQAETVVAGCDPYRLADLVGDAI